MHDLFTPLVCAILIASISKFVRGARLIVRPETSTALLLTTLPDPTTSARQMYFETLSTEIQLAH